jgi:hypothetical protein
MDPALYQHWKRQQADRRKRERQIAARRAPDPPAPPLEPEPDRELEPAPIKKRRPE